MKFGTHLGNQHLPEESAVARFLDLPFEELARDRFLIGGPARIIRELERQHRELGINHWLFRIQWPGMPQALVLKTIRILGEQVIPHFRT